MSQINVTTKPADPALRRLRKLCLSLPETAEVIAWGHPTFRAGTKMFAAYGEDKGERSIGFRVGKRRQQDLVKGRRFYITPYAGRFGWVSLKVAGKLDWNEIAGLVLESYRMTANKRMLAALEED